MSLAFVFHYLMLNMFRMLIYPSSGACDLFVELFHGLYYSGMTCVGVTLWFGWGGVVSGCRLHLRRLRFICWIILRVVLLWYDVCWCYVVVRLGWCGIRMQASSQEFATYLSSYFMGCIALVRRVLASRCGSAGVVWYPYAGRSTNVLGWREPGHSFGPTGGVERRNFECKCHWPWWILAFFFPTQFLYLPLFSL
jgi:hypothetical protein